MEPNRRRHSRRIAAALAIAALLAGFPATSAPSAHPNALWRVVHDLCVPDMRILGRAAPCARVDLAGGFAVLKDPRRRTQLLLVPTRRIVGIESPELLAPRSPNYWRAAWDARALFQKAAGPIPRDDLALAVNSRNGRTQNQLHIHIDCIQLSLRQALDAHARNLSSRWRAFNDFAGGRYRARLVQGDDLGDRDPFRLLAEDTGAAADMADETLVVAAVTPPDGRPSFVLLSARTNSLGGDMAVGEELLDHDCGITGKAKAAEQRLAQSTTSAVAGPGLPRYPAQQRPAQQRPAQQRPAQQRPAQQRPDQGGAGPPSRDAH